MKEFSTGDGTITDDDLVSTGDVARAVGISATAVRKMVDRGEITPAQKMSGRLGMYLFRRSDVQALADKRIAELEAKLAAMRTGGAA